MSLDLGVNGRTLTPEELEGRAPLWAAAITAALFDRDRIEKGLATGEGAWWNEMEPLYPIERTHVLAWLRQHWNMPPDPSYVWRAGRWVKPKTTQEQIESERRLMERADAQKGAQERHQSQEDAYREEWHERSSLPSTKVVDVKQIADLAKPATKN